MVTKKEIQYKNYGRCLEISNGTIRIVVTIDFGPRIICYSFIGGENILFEDTKREFFETNPDMEKVYGKGAVWEIYGGHRLWISPETMPRTYYPDNDPVSYELTENGAIFTPPVQKWTNYGYAIRVSVSEDTTDVTVEHGVTNHGALDIDLSLWPITVLAPGGTEVVPQPTRKTVYNPQTIMAFWDYAKMTDSRLKWLEKYIILKQDKDGDDKMKFGINSEHGFAMYFNHDDLFVKRFEVNPDGCYPDGGMSFETYTNALFLEMESLGELQTVAPDETVWHTEKWSLYKEELSHLTDNAIDIMKEKYIK